MSPHPTPLPATLPNLTPNPPTPPSPRPTLFLDIDNTLYPPSRGIQTLMSSLITQYFSRHLSLTPTDATLLQKKYYKEYGLALTGLVQHHAIDPLAYNREVDDALPLEKILSRDEALIRLLGRVRRGEVRLWLFTNAYVRHALRVVGLLGVDGFFEGVTFCDYEAVPLVAKPAGEMFERAEREAESSGGGGGGGGGSGVVEEGTRFYFVDDSLLNCRKARERGWDAVLKLEVGDPVPEGWGDRSVFRLEELVGIWPRFFEDAGEVRNGAGGGEGEGNGVDGPKEG